MGRVERCVFGAWRPGLNPWSLVGLGPKRHHRVPTRRSPLGALPVGRKVKPGLGMPLATKTGYSGMEHYREGAGAGARGGVV